MRVGGNRRPSPRRSRAAVAQLARATVAVALCLGIQARAASADESPVPCAASWARWDQFKKTFLSADGRVIDIGSPDSRTVSEGQAYALFFALVANDRPAFDTILRWTENNLAGGDLTARLPAWLWGHAQDDRWKVLDANAASDADLWIAYSLLEAGALWHERGYSALGARLAKRVLDEEAADLPGLGLALLPGPQGFHVAPDVWRLNPSYMPLQVIRGIGARLSDDTRWTGLGATSARVLDGSAPNGFAPDWTRFRAEHGFALDDVTHASGSYDAIRVYLWAGMLDSRDGDASRLLTRFAPFASFVAEHGAPPETIDTATGEPGPNLGNAGFAAAAVPFLVASKQEALADAEVTRAESLAGQSGPVYYNSVLMLFGLGWRDGRYRFGPDGALDVAWKTSCQPGVNGGSSGALR